MWRNFAHAPVRGSVGLFTPIVADRYGFVGIEADIDGARQNPVLVAVNLVPSIIPAGLPFKLGLGLPWAIGVSDSAPSYVLMARLWIESAREVEYGRR